MIATAVLLVLAAWALSPIASAQDAPPPEPVRDAVPESLTAILSATGIDERIAGLPRWPRESRGAAGRGGRDGGGQGAGAGIDRMRGAGLGILEMLREELALRPDALTAVGQIELAARWFGEEIEPSSATPRRRIELDRIEDFFSDNHRAMRKALGPDAELEKSSFGLHAWLQRLQAGQGVYEFPPEDGDTDKERRLVEGAVERGRRIDHGSMVTAARDVVAFAFALKKQETPGATPPATGRPRPLGELAPSKPSKPGVGVTGDVLLDRQTAYGRLVIGGYGKNTYDCTLIDVIVDLGGDDEYRGGAGGADELRRYSVCIDLAGEDLYEVGDGALGSATFGLGVFVDLDGNDRYRGGERCAGYGASGVGVFVDAAGKDDVQLGNHSCGVGFYGLGVCVELLGDDVQQAGEGSMGCGLPGGVGWFVDAGGDDRRRLKVASGVAAFGLGAAMGTPMSGGVGVAIDLAGNDDAVAGDRCFGSAIGGGVGIYLDRDGTDSCLGATGAHGTAGPGSIGVCIDLAGDDRFGCDTGLAHAEAGSAAWFFDGGGSDVFETRGSRLALAGDGALACFQDLGGADRIRARPDAVVGVSPPSGDRGETLRCSILRLAGTGPRRIVPATLDPRLLTAAQRGALAAAARKDLHVLLLR